MVGRMADFLSLRMTAQCRFETWPNVSIAQIPVIPQGRGEWVEPPEQGLGFPRGLGERLGHCAIAGSNLCRDDLMAAILPFLGVDANKR